MSGRRVNFRDSPPSSGVSSRYASNSDHGSVSGDYPAGASGGRYSSGSHWNDLPALQEAYRGVLAERDDWMGRVDDLKDELVEAKKEKSEAESKWHKLIEANEQLEEEKKGMFKEIKELKSQLKDANKENDELQDTIDDLKEELAKSNARLNEMQDNMAPAYGTPGTSPHHPSSHLGNAEPPTSTTSTTKSSSSRKEGKSSSKNISSSGSGTSSGSSSHGSSRAKVGSSSSTSTAKLSRSGSRHDRDHDRERERERDRDRAPKDQKTRLSQRFDSKDDSLNDSTASSAASSSSQKHHKSGSSGQGSSGSNTSNDSGNRPPQSRMRRGSYVEGYGPGPSGLTQTNLNASQRQSNMIPPPMSPNKGVPRSAQSASVMGVASGMTGNGGYYTHNPQGYPQQPPAPGYGVPLSSSSGLMSPRGDMTTRTSIRPEVHVEYDSYGNPYSTRLPHR